jgi:hypothetical protein
MRNNFIVLLSNDQAMKAVLLHNSAFGASRAAGQLWAFLLIPFYARIIMIVVSYMQRVSS